MVTNDHERALRAGANGGEDRMAKESGSDRPQVFSRRLIKIMTVMERVRQEAEGKGHMPFADALQHCTMEISGGNMECPLGRLVVDESARTGVFMAFNPKAPAPVTRETADRQHAPVDIDPAAVLEWQETYVKLWNLLKNDARIAKDADCLEALEACHDLTQEHRCPVRELIVQNLWHGKNS